MRRSGSLARLDRCNDNRYGLAELIASRSHHCAIFRARGTFCNCCSDARSTRGGGLPIHSRRARHLENLWCSGGAKFGSVAETRVSEFIQQRQMASSLLIGLRASSDDDDTLVLGSATDDQAVRGQGRQTQVAGHGAHFPDKPALRRHVKSSNLSQSQNCMPVHKLMSCTIFCSCHHSLNHVLWPARKSVDSLQLEHSGRWHVVIQILDSPSQLGR